jgi:hypothetical protein
MVKRVAAPAEHYLITQGSSLVSQFGAETLSKFSLQKLLEHRLTNRNLKAGLDFTDAYKADRARERLVRMLEAYIKKEFAFLFKEGVTETEFLSQPWKGSGSFAVNTFYDKSVVRYVEKINRILVNENLPILITMNQYNTLDLDKIEISIVNNHRQPSLKYYKLMWYLPEVVQFFKTLTRKAMLTDKDAKNLSRSRCSGFVGVGNPQHNGRSQEQAAPASNRATVSRRTRGTASPRTGATAGAVNGTVYST